MKYTISLIAAWLLFCGTVTLAADNSEEKPQIITLADIPALRLEGQKIDVSTYQYLGSWSLDSKSGWQDSIRADLSNDATAIKLTATEKPLSGTLPRRLTLDSESEYFKTISWENEQVSALAFCAVASKPQMAILELDTDTQTAIYNNGKFLKEVHPSDTVETGVHLFMPVALDKGNNLFVVKILSAQQPPKIRMAMVLDQSKDFQVAWDMRMGFLNKSIFPAMQSSDAPVLKWDEALGRLVVSAEIQDCQTGTIVLKKERLRNGSIIRDNASYLKEGLYKITYTAGENSAFEYFLIGSPRKAFENLKALLQPDLADNEKSAINIKAQIKRGEILLDRKNYDVENPEWQAKVVYTLSELASLSKMIKDGSTNLSNGVPGLHIRGFVSKIDNSTQFYRLFVPSTYAPAQDVPLLLIMPTPVSAQTRSFIESPFMASHYQALQVCRYAEKYGFAVLWPGYRNAPDGWPCENVHIDEAIKAVEKDYNIDKSRISLYGICGGGFFAGRLVETYPKCFAAIVYDRAYFKRDADPTVILPDFLKYWYAAIDPIQKIIDNKNIKIFVLNDGSKPEGHGEMQISEQFLKIALTTRPDIKYALGQRPIGVELWDQIFGWLSECKNNGYSGESVNDLSSYGYVGPICGLFSTPFIVVEGTSSDAEGNTRIQETVKALQEQYARQLFGVSFVLKKDTEITDEDIKTHSLVLIGNPESNVVWDKLKSELPVKLTTDSLAIDGQAYPHADAFEVIAKNPINKDNYVLLIGAKDLKYLTLTKALNPVKAAYDCNILEPYGEYHRQHIINTLLKPSQSP